MKLEAALDRFRIDPKDKICLDVGASTGGFTEVLLARGASRVYAVDTGTGQLHKKIRCDPRVVSLERTDIRRLDDAAIRDDAQLIVIDVSFISLELVLPQALNFAAPHAELIALIKPQFEAGREHVKKGIVRDPEVHMAVCQRIELLVAGRAGACAAPFRAPSPAATATPSSCCTRNIDAPPVIPGRTEGANPESRTPHRSLELLPWIPDRAFRAVRNDIRVELQLAFLANFSPSAASSGVIHPSQGRCIGWQPFNRRKRR